MKNSEYWRRRSERLMAQELNKGIDYYNRLSEQYDKASKRVQEIIELFFARYAAEEGISYAEAKKQLTNKERKEFLMSVEEYQKLGSTNSDEFDKVLERASTSHHIDRLTAAKIEMQQQVENLYGNELDGIDELIRDVYETGYYRTAYEIQKGIGAGTTIQHINPKEIEKLLSKPWAADGKNFSERIWESHRPQLVNYLETEFTQAIITGTNPATLIEDVSKKFGVSKRQAGTLLMTESSYFASEATKDCYNDLGLEQYQICATLDNKTSELCQGLDGQVFDMKDYKSGITAPPFHPNCRTTTVPYIDDEFEREYTRVARDKEGNNYKVPQDMTYPEWKEQFVEDAAKKS